MTDAQQQALNALPPSWQHTAVVVTALVALLTPHLALVTRGIHALMNGRGLKGMLSGIWLGTNTPKPTDPPNKP